MTPSEKCLIIIARQFCVTTEHWPTFLGELKVYFIAIHYVRLDRTFLPVFSAYEKILES